MAIAGQRYYILTYGCQMNQRDSESMGELLEQLGMEPASGLDEADLVIFNTCCIREGAERKIYGRLSALKERKQRSPSFSIGVGGCLAQKDREGVLEQAPHVDFVLGTADIHRLPTLVREAREGVLEHRVCVGHPAQGQPGEPLPRRRASTWQALVNISYGCNNACGYCIVPLVRGAERHREPGAILDEVHHLVAAGYREVTLLGQNVNSYGRLLAPAISFGQLLRQVDEVPGLERIRFTTSHPRDFHGEILAAMRCTVHVCEHIHLPVQAGSNRILQAMNRGYSREQYLELVDFIRDEVPGASITTDLIVGYPGETEEDFAQTLDLVEQARFDNAFTFMYSPRRGTPAYAAPQQVAPEIKNERLQRLMQRQHAISYEKNLVYQGQTVEVLVEGKQRKQGKTWWQGRTRTNRIVLFPAVAENLGGCLVQVQITRPQTWNLYAERVKSFA